MYGLCGTVYVCASRVDVGVVVGAVQIDDVINAVATPGEQVRRLLLLIANRSTGRIRTASASDADFERCRLEDLLVRIGHRRRLWV